MTRLRLRLFAPNILNAIRLPMENLDSSKKMQDEVVFFW
jgi:hypothetical protein